MKVPAAQMLQAKLFEATLYVPELHLKQAVLVVPEERPNPAEQRQTSWPWLVEMRPVAAPGEA